MGVFKHWIMFLIFAFDYMIITEEVECEFSKKDFISLGRHIWRCKAKFEQSSFRNHESVNTNNVAIERADISMVNLNDEHGNVNPEAHETNYDRDMQSTSIVYYECHCGKKCKGLQGLKAHQRSCHITLIEEFKDLFTFDNNTEEQNGETTVENLK